MSSDIKVKREGHVGWVEICRPPHNFFDADLIRAIADAYEAFDADKACRAIILAAEGKSFCAGGRFLPSGAKEAGGPRDAVSIYDAAGRLFETKTPVIAAVEGAATGGGFGLALSADFRVVSPRARFWANFVKLGFHPGFAVSLTLAELIGTQRAALLLYTARRLGGEEAVRWGVADILAEDARAVALELANEIAANAPLAVVSTRQTLRGGLALRARARMDAERREQMWLMRTEDHLEGVRAVTERRPGIFQSH